MIGIKIKELRELYKKTQDDLAKFLGVAPQTIYKYEKGINEPDLKTINKIAEYFNVTTDYLLGRTNNPNEKKFKHLDNTLIGRVSTKIEKMDDDELELLDKLVDKLMKDDK